MFRQDVRSGYGRERAAFLPAEVGFQLNGRCQKGVETMSEYQLIAFEAVDRPLTDKELAYARKQSTRAEITRKSFTNEYHFGDFHGNALGLMRHGYDIHLHYANFGVRRILIRLPDGPPFPSSIWNEYVDGERIAWHGDKKGPSGILEVAPFFEEMNELWDPHEYVKAVVQIRHELLAGDLRALYTLWLCSAYDSNYDPEEAVEPSVPAGIGQASIACKDLLCFFEVDPLVLAAAGENALPCPDRTEIEQLVTQWIERLSTDEARKRVEQFLTGDPNQVKSEIMILVRNESADPVWPTSPGSRTIEQLFQRTEQLRDEEEAREKARKLAQEQRAAKRKEKERKERMVLMAKEPQAWIEKAGKLVEARGTANYKSAAEMLADLGEAIGGEKGAKLVHHHAEALAKKHPTLTRLKSSLRKQGLLS